MSFRIGLSLLAIACIIILVGGWGTLWLVSDQERQLSVYGVSGSVHAESVSTLLAYFLGIAASIVVSSLAFLFTKGTSRRLTILHWVHIAGMVGGGTCILHTGRIHWLALTLGFMASGVLLYSVTWYLVVGAQNGKRAEG
jgi:hypothetical protein